MLAPLLCRLPSPVSYHAPYFDKMHPCCLNISQNIKGDLLMFVYWLLIAEITREIWLVRIIYVTLQREA